MVMETLQIRLSKGIVNRIDALVKTGMYASRSDAIRDATRRLVIEQMTGSISHKGDSVRHIRTLRKQLSNAPFNLKEINRLAE